MSKRIFFFIALILTVSQGWASPVDSLRIKPQTLNHFSHQWNGDKLVESGALPRSFNPNAVIDGSILNGLFDDETVTVTPSSLTFDEQLVGTSETLSFEVEYQCGIFGLTSPYVVVDDPNFTASLVYVYTEYFGNMYDVYKFNVTYKPTTAGTHKTTARVLVDQEGWFSTSTKTIATVELEGTAISPSIIVPSSPVTFSNAILGNMVTKTFEVTGIGLTSQMNVALENNEDGMFSIVGTGITSESNRTIVTVTVGFTPTVTGTYNANVIISSNGAETKTISLIGSTLPSTVTPSVTSLNFGNVVKNGTCTKSFTITGTNLMGHLSLSSNSPYYTITPAIISANNAANGATVTVTYNPTEVGTHNARLHINGSGLENSQVDISLSGTCVTDQSITITPSTYDFGTVNKGNEVTKTFTITGNNLNSRISVANQMETTGDEFTVSPTDLPASGGTVTVKYKPLYAGSAGAAFTFSSGEASARLAVTGNCVIPPNINTSVSSLDFGTVAKGKEVKKTFTVTGTSLTGGLTLSSSNSQYHVSPTLLPASGGTVTVTYTPTDGGNHSGSITISGGGASSKTVNLTGKCAAITISPSTFDFGTVNKGNQVSKTFTVTGTNLSGRISVVTQMETTGGEYMISPTDLPANGGNVTVTFKPVAAGSSGAAFTFSDGVASARLAVEGKCVNTPKITVSASSLAFGNVVKGNSSKKTFTVTGTDLTGSLTISSSNSNFTVTPTTITAAQAKAGATVTVTYKPTATGSHSGTITISGGGATSKTVSVTGKCVVPAITVSSTYLHFGSNSSQTIRVTGTNLTGNLSLVVKGGNGVFTVSPSTITSSQAAAGVTVTVNCNAASNQQRATATITISGGGASAKTVSLSYDKGGIEPMAGLILPDGESENENTTDSQVLGNSATNVSELAMDVKIYAEGQDIIIESPVQQSAIVSDIAGHACGVNLQAGRNVIPAGASGVHIVRVGEKTAKLMLR